MGDCYYHGMYDGHRCRECEEEERRGLEPGTIRVDPDIFKAKAQMAMHRDDHLFKKKRGNKDD
jgi:hypothetical protein